MRSCRTIVILALGVTLGAACSQESLSMEREDAASECAPNGQQGGCANGLICVAGQCAFPGAGQGGGCSSDAECQSGFVCTEGRCEQLAAEEEEDARTFLRPTASEHFVFALSTDGNSVAIIDPLTLAIEAVPLPEEPLSAEVIPGEDAVLVLSRQGRALSLVVRTENAWHVRSQRLPRRFNAVSLSPDGKWAVLWTPDGQLPDAGAEGLVALASVDALAAGTPTEPLERAAGRRHTNVFFRALGGVAHDAVIVGHQELAVIALEAPAARPVPERIALPDEYTEIARREAVSPPGGSVVLLRSLDTADLAVFEVATRSITRVTLPSPASDLDLLGDGTEAIAVLRDEGKVLRFDVPAAVHRREVTVSLPGLGCSEESCAFPPGQAALSPDGRRAVLFTNARSSEAIAVLDLETDDLVVFDRLEKYVRSVGLSPDGTRAIVLHRPNPEANQADEYERMVDRAQGYSVVDLEAGVGQLKLTGTVPPQEFVFATDPRFAAVTLRDDQSRTFAVESIDLSTLITRSLPLASAPQFCGAIPGATPDARVWVTQSHPAGRISFVDLGSGSVRTATGYELNSEIGR